MSDPTAYTGDSIAAEVTQDQEAYTRPEGITEKQDEIIQHVAKFVINSCNGAMYQHKLRQQTKYNPFFQFLDPNHQHHIRYQYLLDSYQYWRAVEQAAGSNGLNSEALEYYQQQVQAEQYQHQEPQPSSGDGAGAVMPRTANLHPGHTTASSGDKDPTGSSHGTFSHLHTGHQQPAAGMHAAVAQSQDDMYEEEYVYENGVLVPKRHS